MFMYITFCNYICIMSVFVIDNAIFKIFYFL